MRPPNSFAANRGPNSKGREGRENRKGSTFKEIKVRGGPTSNGRRKEGERARKGRDK